LKNEKKDIDEKELFLNHVMSDIENTHYIA